MVTEPTSAMYTIRYRRDLDLLDITWCGLFTAEGMSQYATDCRAALKKEGFREGFLLRVVLTDNQTLPKDTANVLGRVFFDFPKPGKTAMVTASAIAKMQIKRLAMAPNTEIFDTREAALDWLTHN